MKIKLKYFRKKNLEESKICRNPFKKLKKQPTGKTQRNNHKKMSKEAIFVFNLSFKFLGHNKSTYSQFMLIMG